MVAREPNVLKLKRWQVYEPWRAAAEAVGMMRGVLRGDHVIGDARESFRLLAEQLPAIAASLPLEARTAAHDLVPAMRVRPPIEDLLQFTWPVFVNFGRLLMNIDGLQPAFAADLPPLEMEKRLLTAAFEMETTDSLGATVNVLGLSNDSGVDLAMTRRVLCYWLDGGQAYLPHDLVEPDVTECFVLDVGADARRDDWHEYAETRIALRRTRVDIPYDDPLPHHWKETVEGAAMHLGLVCEIARPTKVGVIVNVIVPEEWAAHQTQEFIDDVRTMFARERIQAAVHAPVSNHYVATQVGAQGPNATATNNTFIQNMVGGSWDEAERTAVIEELVTLRGVLLKTAGSDLEDGRAFGIVSQAELAARQGDRTGMAAALAALGPRLATLCGQLGLTRISKG